MLSRRILSLTGGSLLLVLSASHGQAQVACMSAEGNWSGAGGTWALDQNRDKTISGVFLNSGASNCPGGHTWAVTGRVGSQGGDFRLTAVFASLGPRPETCAQTIVMDGSLFKPGCNNATGTWANSGNYYGTFDMATSCKVPAETTPEFVEWGTPGHDETIARFRQNLTPFGFNYGGRYIQEFFAADAVDTCYFVGSKYTQLVTMPAKPRIHLSDQEPAAFSDFVGMRAELVNYFRQKNVSPCGYYLRQRMRTDCDFGEYVFQVNDLELSQTPFNVASGRGPTKVYKPWGIPPPARTAIPVIINILLGD